MSERLRKDNLAAANGSYFVFDHMQKAQPLLHTHRIKDAVTRIGMSQEARRSWACWQVLETMRPSALNKDQEVVSLSHFARHPEIKALQAMSLMRR